MPSDKALSDAAAQYRRAQVRLRLCDAKLIIMGVVDAADLRAALQQHEVKRMLECAGALNSLIQAMGSQG